MRICSPQLGLSPDAALGGEVYDREILTCLAGLGTEIEILLPAGLPCPEVPGWNVTHLPLRRGYRWFVSNLLFVPYIGRAYRQWPFDVLRVHSLRFTGLAALWARKLYGLRVPIIAHHHHLDRDRWTNQVERRVAHAADLIVTGSQFAREQLIAELGVPRAKIAVVYYGVSERYRPLVPSERLQRQLNLIDRPVLLYVGSLKPRKNLPILLEAFKKILAQVPQTCLILIGRGPDEAALRSQVDCLGIGHAVRFAGFVTEQQKLEYYSVANLFVSPSLMEGFGLAVGEAMACGLPIVTTRAGSLPEVVRDGETGLLVPPGDVDALCESILRVLRDEALTRQMGRAGQARVERLFRWDESARCTLALYQEAMRLWQA